MNRAQIAREIQLSFPAVADLVAELIEIGIAQEMPRVKTARGQPPIPVGLRNDGAYSIGLHIDSRTYRVVRIDLLGGIIAEDMGETPPEQDTDWASFVARLFEECVIKQGKDNCLGMGIVTPGPFASKWPNTPGSIAALQKRGFSESVGRLTNSVIVVENDATAAAFGEHLFGKAKGLKNYFYIFVGSGVGAGIIAGGQPYSGANGNAGEFGHIVVHTDGLPCYCGLHGCLGQYLSTSSRHRALEAARAAGIAEAEAAANWLKDAKEALRRGIATIENLFEPELIILGGTAPIELLHELEAVRYSLLPSLRDGLKSDRLVMSAMPSGGVAMAAAALPLLRATMP